MGVNGKKEVGCGGCLGVWGYEEDDEGVVKEGVGEGVEGEGYCSCGENSLDGGDKGVE